MCRKCIGNTFGSIELKSVLLYPPRQMNREPLGRCSVVSFQYGWRQKRGGGMHNSFYINDGKTNNIKYITER